MGQVKRIYVEKKAPYAVRAKELKEEVRQYLGITALRDVRVLIRYDVENLSDATYKQALMTVFSEPPVDDCYEESFTLDPDAFVLFGGISSGTVRPESRFRRTVCEASE